MFASKDMFDDEGDTENFDSSNRPQSAAVIDENSLYFKTAPASSSSFSSSSTSSNHNDSRPSTAIGGDPSKLSLAEEAFLAPTPQMRKQKMAELKQQQLAKRKNKPLANSGMMRTHQGPKAVAAAAAAASSPTNRPTTPNTPTNNNNSTTSFSRVPSYTSSSASASSSSSLTSHSNSSSAPNSSETSGYSPIASESSIQALINERKAEKEQKQISSVEREMQALGIAPVFDPVKKISGSVKLDFSDMRNFLTSPLPKGMLVQCYIIRNKKGLKNKVYPSYELYLEEENKFLLASKKRSQNKTSNYLMSMDKKNMDKESASYLGKVRSNFVGTEFVAYDKGINPKDVDESNASISLMTVRQELTAVFYESNILGSRGPRKMTAVVPSLKKDGTRHQWRPLNEQQSIVNRFKQDPVNPEFFCLTNKTPKWNDQVGAYVLNFSGRVTMASVKNFQLIHQDDPETVVLQFGRVGKDQFTMDFQYPLSPLQAFAICLSSFDYKLACE